MPRRFLTHGEAKAFYDRFGSKQDWQHWYEGAARAVFELGCGTGAFAAELLAHRIPHTARYLGVDVSSTMVDLPRKRLDRFADRTEVVLMDGALRFDVPDASFDRFVANYVLDIFSPDDIQEVLDKAYCLLASDGRLCVVSLTPGHTLVARMVTGLWHRVHRLNPRWVGGCRPLRLQDHLHEAHWRINHHHVVTAYGVASEVVIASKGPISIVAIAVRGPIRPMGC
jgi:ubiquinone/menaquinone biosynthesis C-methylase UbiE